MRAFRLASLCVCVSVESVCGEREGGSGDVSGGGGWKRWGGVGGEGGGRVFSNGNVLSHEKDRSVLSEEASCD